MADEPDQQPEPTQKTPAGLEIPVPKREDVRAFFRKVFRSSDEPPDEDERQS
jgi:hypothetical protein